MAPVFIVVVVCMWSLLICGQSQMSEGEEEEKEAQAEAGLRGVPILLGGERAQRGRRGYGNGRWHSIVHCMI